MARFASPPPRQDFRFDSAATSPYATAPPSLHGPFGSVEGAAGGTCLSAPTSPNTFGVLPPATSRLAGANPFDLFQHFTSAPASPRRAAAIYAYFAEGNDGGNEEEEFQPRASYSTNASAVPFDWEERPGTPKAGIGGGAAWDTDFEFGTLVDNTVAAKSLTTADELFEKGKIRPLKTADEPSDKGKIRPLKPPPGLLDGGSVGSSPRSPMARGPLSSPRRRSRVGSGFDFDPFAAALLEATKAPSLLGDHDANGVAPSRKHASFPTSRPASKIFGRRKWRLSDLLLFRSTSDGGRFDKHPGTNRSPAQQPDDQAPARKASAPTPTAKANKGKFDDKGAAAAEAIAGCARLSPLQRLAKALGARMVAPGTKG